MLSRSTRSLVDPKSDALSCTHDGIVSFCAHRGGPWPARSVVTLRGVDFCDSGRTHLGAVSALGLRAMEVPTIP